MSKFTTALIGCVLAIAPAIAGAADATSQQVRELETVKRELAQKSITTKGIGRHKLALEERKVDGLIDDLKSGKPVPPSEIDRVLQEAEKLAD